MYEIQGHLLCLEHHNMIIKNAQIAQQNNMAMMNYYKDQIDEVFGLPPSSARIHIPQPVVNNSPVTHNHINVSESVVGSINTAQVGRINVAMEQITNEGHEEVGRAIKELTEAIVNNAETDKVLKDKLVEQLGFLAEQATLPKEQRQDSVIKMVLKSIPTTIGVAASLTTVWAQWRQTLTTFFKT